LRKELSSEALARRDTFNATASGKANLLGDRELVDAITSGRVELDEIEEENLPASLQALAPAEQMEVIGEQAKRRDELQQEIRQLSASRSSYIKQKVEAEGGADDSLDEKESGGPTYRDLVGNDRIVANLNTIVARSPPARG